MKLTKDTILTYSNFNALTQNIVELAKEILPDKVIYINFLNESEQVTLRVSRHNTKVSIAEDDTIPVHAALCNQINYEEGKPLVLSDVRNNSFDEAVNNTIKAGNLGSYLGIPILFKDGNRFGALCAAHHDQSEFDNKEILLMQNIANLFSYYLELEHIAYRDALTGLNNKRFLLANEERILKSDGVMIMFDLDNFKEVNDNFGHDVGDLVLKEVGTKLNAFINGFAEAHAIRLGGDEFIIYIHGEQDFKLINEALIALVKSLRKWKTPIGNVGLSSSVGALRFRKNTLSFEALLKRVDELLYIAKRNGKDTYVFE